MILFVKMLNLGGGLLRTKSDIKIPRRVLCPHSTLGLYTRSIRFVGGVDVVLSEDNTLRMDNKHLSHGKYLVGWKPTIV